MGCFEFILKLGCHIFKVKEDMNVSLLLLSSSLFGKKDAKVHVFPILCKSETTFGLTFDKMNMSPGVEDSLGPFCHFLIWMLYNPNSLGFISSKEIT